MSTVLNIDRFIIPNDVIVSIANIYKWIGQNKFFKDIVKNDLDKIVDQTVERDAFFLAQILELDISDSRTRLIIIKNSTPRNKEEATLYNLKETLTNIQRNYKNLRFQSNDVLNIINYIYPNYKDIKFDFIHTSKRSVLKSQAATSKRIILDEINDQLEIYIHKNDYEKITLFLNYFIDFYNIGPFTDKNYTAALVLLYLLIFQCDLEAFKYISFFELLFANYKEFQTEVKNASFNWKEGFAQTLSFVRFMNKLIIKGYEKAHSIIKDYKFDANLNKADNIGNTISKLPDIFTKEEIRIVHPYVSESTINRALKQLRDEGRIKPLGKGRSAKWVKIYKGFNYE
jgi:hypothetical protein